VHCSPELAWFRIFEHSTLALPPFLGLMSMPEKCRFSHGVDALQWMPTATLYRLVPVMFSQRMSLILRREESQFWYESVQSRGQSQ
jgi:hypothetical protein